MNSSQDILSLTIVDILMYYTPPPPLTCRIPLTNMYLQGVESNMDPDQLASKKPTDLDLLCFRNWIYLGSAEGYML